ncbi:hypothetical protein C172_04158 [Paenibacillus sp. FSL H8-457]|nr:hypothetical protein C172_04158 [Paenibacillus sp. FSL H8-457]
MISSTSFNAKDIILLKEGNFQIKEKRQSTNPLEDRPLIANVYWRDQEGKPRKLFFRSSSKKANQKTLANLIIRKPLST